MGVASRTTLLKILAMGLRLIVQQLLLFERSTILMARGALKSPQYCTANKWLLFQYHL